MVIEVILVDDHKILRQGVRGLLEAKADIEVVGEAASGYEGLELISRISPDVAVVDIGLEDMSGIKLTKLIKGSSPDTEVVILSMHDDPGYVRAALQSGARGYVVKGSDINDLASAIRAVFDGQEYVRPHRLAGNKG